MATEPRTPPAQLHSEKVREIIGDVPAPLVRNSVAVLLVVALLIVAVLCLRIDGTALALRILRGI